MLELFWFGKSRSEKQPTNSNSEENPNVKAPTPAATLERQIQQPQRQQTLSEEDRESQEDGYLDRNEEEDADLIEFGL